MQGVPVKSSTHAQSMANAEHWPGAIGNFIMRTIHHHPPKTRRSWHCVECIANPFAFVILKQQWADPHGARFKVFAFPQTWSDLSPAPQPGIFPPKEIWFLNIYLGSWRSWSPSRSYCWDGSTTKAGAPRLNGCSEAAPSWPSRLVVLFVAATRDAWFWWG